MDAGSTSTGWYYAKQGMPGAQPAGPYSWEEFSSLARAGSLTPSDLVWNQALPSWLPGAQILGLFPSVPSAAQPAVTQIRAPQPPTPQPVATQPVVPQPGPYGWGAQPPAAYGWGTQPPAGYPPRPRRSLLWWVIPLIIVVLAGAGLGVYFGFLRDGDDVVVSTTSTTKRTTTTTTEAPTTTTTVPTTTTTASTTTTTTEPASWAETSPSTGPSPREAHSMVYDAGSTLVLLFGGWDVDYAYNDTWAYDAAANTWTDLAPAGDLPTERAFHLTAYDSDTGVVFLFGGLHGDLGYFADTWAYDSFTNTWTELSPGGDQPPAAVQGAMVYDPGTAKVIMFGGWLEDDVVSNDTWAYDPAANTWTRLDPSGDLPPARFAHTMAYDPAGGQVILFGGETVDGDVFGDTWAYDPASNTWTELDPAGDLPSPRSGHAMVYESLSARMILFGGWGGNFGLDDTWAYDPAANTWTELAPAGDRPPGRDAFSMAYDSFTGRVVMFGGWDDETDRGDTWVFGGQWGF